jgi:hypothetical protein
MQNQKTNQPPFKKKPVLALFALIALISGVYFLDKPMTGNVVLSNHYEMHAVSIIGILLILCSIILVAYYFHRHR